MFICPSCGARLNEELQTCPVCGASFEGLDPYTQTEGLIDDAGPEVARDAAGEYSIGLGVSESIGAAFRLWTGALGQLVLLALIQMVLPLAFGIAMAVILPALVQDSGAVIGILVILGPVLLAGMIAVSIPATIGMYLILDDHARHGGPRRSVNQAFVEGYQYLWRYLGVSLLLGLTFVLITAPIWLAVALEAGGVAFLFGLGAAVAIIWLAVRWSVLFPALVAEDRPGIESMGRSAELVSGYWWLVFGAFVVFGLLVFGVALVVSALGLIPIVGQIISIAFQLLAGTLATAFTFAIYAGLVGQKGRGHYG